MFSLTLSEMWAVVQKLKWFHCLYIIHLKDHVQMRHGGDTDSSHTFYFCINCNHHALVTVPTSSFHGEESPIPGIFL